MARLAVDPAVLAGAGVGLIGVGEGLGPAVTVLSAAYNANTGQDFAGVMFGRHYQDAGRGIMKSVAAGINALLRTGYGVQVSAVNYSRAEANSDLSRRAQQLESPPCPVDVSAPAAPSPLGGGVGEPALWAVVELLVGDLWPNGSPAQMRTAAASWRSFASVLYGISGDVSAPYNTVAAQEIPEAESIKSVIREIEGVFGQLAMASEALATAVEGFAADVENTQNAIRRLLARLGSIGAIVGMFFEFVRGHGEEELHEIAADIRTVLDHLKSEADAKKAMFDQALRDFEALNQAMQIAADREFREFFGEDVGNVLSGLWRAGGDIDRGVARWTASTVEGIEDLNPARAFYDPHGALQTWKGLAQMAQVVTNPVADPELTKEILKGVARVDEWKTQRPLTALTENALDLGSLFLGPEAAVGGVAKVGELGDVAKVADMADGSRLTGALGKLGEIPRPVGALDEITTRTGQLSKELETTGLAPTGGKPVGGPVIDKPAAAPPVEKPAAAPAVEAKPVGGKPVSPDKPSNLPASPVESRPVPTPEAKAGETPGAPKASMTETAKPAPGDHAPGTPAAQPSEIPAQAGAGTQAATTPAGHPGGDPASPLGDGQFARDQPAAAAAADKPGGPPGGLTGGEEPDGAVAAADPPGGPRPGDPMEAAATPEKADVFAHAGGAPEKAEFAAHAGEAPEKAEFAAHAGGAPEKAEAAAHGGAGNESIDAAVDEQAGGPTGGGDHLLGAGGDTGGRAQGGGDSPSVSHSGGRSDSAAAFEVGSSDLAAEHVVTPHLLPGEGVNFGLTPANAFDLLTNPADDIARLRDAGTPEHVLEGYDPLAGRTIEQFTQDFTVVAEEGSIQWDWTGQAPNDGFAGPPSVSDRIPSGKELDRFGSEFGGFMAADGSPLSSRGMPPGVASTYNRYFGTGVPVPAELPWEVRYGPAKEAFGQPGGAEQWVVIDVNTLRAISLDLLLRKGIVRAR